ncbi:MAG: hypothetical protein KIG21_05215, partial [Angelakisella sp.]|nr:hypothetical protein [Angelakisella sp.]
PLPASHGYCNQFARRMQAAPRLPLPVPPHFVANSPIIPLSFIKFLPRIQKIHPPPKNLLTFAIKSAKVQSSYKNRR